MSTLPDRLKEAMTLRDMTQADIVRQTGINKSALSCYISGKYLPKQNAIYKLAKALNVNEAWLMGVECSNGTQSQSQKTKAKRTY